MWTKLKRVISPLFKPYSHFWGFSAGNTISCLHNLLHLQCLNSFFSFFIVGLGPVTVDGGTVLYLRPAVSRLPFQSPATLIAYKLPSK